MASNAFLAAVQRMKQSKNLDTPIGNSQYLKDGDEVAMVVQSVDTSKLDEATPTLTIQFKTDDGKEQTNRYFVFNRENDGFSIDISRLVAACLGNRTTMFADLLEADQRAFEILTGMKVRVKWQREKKGYETRVVSGGKFAAYDVATGEKLTDEYEDVKEARDAAKAAGKYAARLKAYRHEACAVETNQAAFDKAMAEASIANFNERNRVK